jgi:hypothetical protein
MLDVMMPMWMSTTGSNSRFDLSGHLSVGFAGWSAGSMGRPVSSLMHFGFTRPATRSGTASARICCLSAIDRELSMASRRSSR